MTIDYDDDGKKVVSGGVHTIYPVIGLYSWAITNDMNFQFDCDGFGHRYKDYIEYITAWIRNHPDRVRW